MKRAPKIGTWVRIVDSAEARANHCQTPEWAIGLTGPVVAIRPKRHYVHNVCVQLDAPVGDNLVKPVDYWTPADGIERAAIGSPANDEGR